MKKLSILLLIILTSCKEELPAKLMNCGFDFENKKKCIVEARFKDLDSCQYYLKFSGGKCDYKDPAHVVCDTTYQDLVQDYCSY